MKVLSVWAFLFLVFLCKPLLAVTASWYDTKSCQKEGTSGVYTASGARFNDEAYTCAIRSRNFGKSYRVTNLKNGKSVVVLHNDFGPARKLVQKGRVIDLSRGAFSAIAPLSDGVIPVKVEAI